VELVAPQELCSTQATTSMPPIVGTACSQTVAGKQVKQQKTVDIKLKIGYI